MSATSTFKHWRRGQRPRESASPECEAWGLSAARYGELKSELDDHLVSLSAEEGLPAVNQVEQKLKQPQVRRALAAPHLADQVYATLNRRPTQREWRELFVLLSWFALILLSDWLASLHFRSIMEGNWVAGYSFDRQPALVVITEVGAWLLQAGARAGFFVSLLASLARAWRVGAGVWLARILQLKLIHTLLVIGAMLVLGRTIWIDGFYEGLRYVLPWPTWLTPPVMLGAGIVFAASLLLTSRLRYWPAAVGVLLTISFLYPGAPIAFCEIHITRPIATDSKRISATQWEAVPSTDMRKIAERATKLASKTYSHMTVAVDTAKNRWTYRDYYVDQYPFVLTERGDLGRPNKYNLDFYKDYAEYKELGLAGVVGPTVVPGGGIGWLAVPIPFLGLIGLLGLLIVMGKRSPLDLLVYFVLCGMAFLATILPFFVAEGGGYSMFIGGPKALVLSPFVGFVSVLGEDYYKSFFGLTLVGGLVISAGMPLLLTALFLRLPRASDPAAAVPVQGEPA